jgi:hypothetical protein
MRGRTKRGVAERSLSFKSGRNGSKIGPYLLAGSALHTGNTFLKN